MYQALYRKYRPKNLNDVVDQAVVIQTLKNSIQNDKISHAYLFTGPRGSGKTSIAKIFAKILNCQNLEGIDPCEKCVCCTQNQEQNMDIIEMDAASNNGVDEIREINNKVNLVPSFGKYKIYIIDEVHMLTIGAFNALLKTLEEPPAHVIFILATTDPHKVPITILSRCQRFDFKKISEENIYKRLKYICEKEKIEITDEAVWEISRLGEGSLRDAITSLDQIISYTSNKISLDDVYIVNGIISQKEIANILNSIIQKDLKSVLEEISNYNNSGKSIVKITEEIILFLRNVLLCEINNDDNEIYSSMKNKLKQDEIFTYIDILNQSLFDMKKFSNPKIILELAIIKIVNKNNVTNLNKSEEQIKQVEVISEPIPDEKVTISKSQKINKEVTEDQNSEFHNFMNRRINNTLATFSKKETINIKQKLCRLMDYVMDEKYNIYATMILDGELKAASENSVIFVYRTETLADLFNENLIKIEELLSEIFQTKYNAVATDINNWNELKDRFNSRKAVFKYEEENISLIDLLSKMNKTSEDKIKSLFGELVEYK